MRSVRRRALSLVIGAAWLVAGASASAEDALTRAAELFKDGERAFQSGDFPRAARLFEEAQVLRPHLSTVWNAARSRHRAGDVVRAANLYAQFVAQSPPSAERRVAEEALANFRPTLAELAFELPSGAPSEIVVDGEPVVGSRWFVSPGEHDVSMTSGAREHRRIRAAAGGLTTVSFMPAPPPAPRGDADEAPRSSGLAPIFAVVGGGLTLAVGGLTAWSGADTLSRRDAYEASLSRADYDAGKNAEQRTNILLVGAAGALVVTGIVALLTDWHAPLLGARAKTP